MSKFNRGIGLIEVMVSVVIMMIALVGGVVYYSNFQQTQVIEDAKKELIANIKLARNYAATMQTPKNFSGRLSHVRVDFNGQQMTILAVNESGTATVYKTVSINSEATMTKQPAELYFSRSDGKLLATSGGVLTPRGVGETLRVTVSFNSQSSFFDINSYGLINERVE